MRPGSAGVSSRRGSARGGRPAGAIAHSHPLPVPIVMPAAILAGGSAPPPPWVPPYHRDPCPSPPSPATCAPSPQPLGRLSSHGAGGATAGATAGAGGSLGGSIGGGGAGGARPLGRGGEGGESSRVESSRGEGEVGGELYLSLLRDKSARRAAGQREQWVAGEVSEEVSEEVRRLHGELAEARQAIAYLERTRAQEVAQAHKELERTRTALAQAEAIRRAPR